MPATDRAPDARELAADPQSRELDIARCKAAADALSAFDPAAGTPEQLTALLDSAIRAARRAEQLEFEVWAAETGADFARAIGRPGIARPAVEGALARTGLTDETRDGLAYIRAQLCSESGAQSEALRACAELVERRAKAGVRDAEFDTQVNSLRCGLEIALGLPDLAAASLAVVKRLAAELGPVERAYAFLNEIDLRAATDEHEEALRVFAEAMRDPVGIDEEPGLRATFEARAAVAHAEVARGKGDSTEARELFASALARPTLRSNDRLDVHLARAELDLRVGLTTSATADLEAAEHLLANLGADGGFEQRARLAALRMWQVHDARAPAGEFEVALARLRAAFATVNAARARVPRRAGGESSLWFGTQRLILSELIRAELAALPQETACERALQVLVDEQHVRSADRAASSPRVRDVLRDLAKPGRGILVLMPAMERSHAFACDPRGNLTHHQLGPRDDLRRVTQGLVGPLSVPPWKDADTERRELELERARAAFSAAMLGDGLSQRIASWEEVLVVGAEFVLAAPLDLALLPDGRELGQWLSISYCSSLPVARALAARALPAPDTSIVVAACTTPSEDARALRPDLGDIPFDEDELLRWRRAAEPLEITAIPRGSATPQALRGAVAGGATLVVLAHGVYDARSEFPARLAVDGGLLRRDDIVGPGAAWPEAVLLLACGTGRGLTRFGDDTATHLGTAFLEGGSSCVLVSRGELELAAATTLTEEILRARAKEGLDLGQALAAARRALASDPRTRDPFYRGLVSLQGVVPPARTRASGIDDAGSSLPAEAGNTTSRWLVPAVIALVAIMARGLALRRRRKASPHV